MNMLSLFNNFANDFFEICKKIEGATIEFSIENLSDECTKSFYSSFLNMLDKAYFNSNDRKKIYYSKAIVRREILTVVGYVNVTYHIYQNKNDNSCYCFIRDDVLNFKPYQRISNEAEYKIIKYASENNMSQAARYAIKNVILSRATISNKIRSYNGTLPIVYNKINNQRDILYIEMDEIHVNMQKQVTKKGKFQNNKICPAAVVHEGHKEKFVKRKELFRQKNFATSTLSYKGLWHIIYDYVSNTYDIDKFKAIFISGDGASGIKNFQNVFPNAIFVLDKFHYKKALKCIFKKNTDLIKLADEYLRNDRIDDFKTLVNSMIKEYPTQKKAMKDKQKYILNNIEGIKNQNHKLYECPCSMEGHISNKYARYITSSPYGFSNKGLKNKLELLVSHANKDDITFKDFLHFKYGKDEYKKIYDKYEKITNKYDHKGIFRKEYNPLPTPSSLPIFDRNIDNDKLLNLIKTRKEVYVY